GRAGIPGHHHRLGRADIDAQFQRVGRDHGADRTIPQLALDLAALARQIAATVPANAFAWDRSAIAGVLEIGHQDLGGEPVVGKDYRLQLALDELEREPA